MISTFAIADERDETTTTVDTVEAITEATKKIDGSHHAIVDAIQEHEQEIEECVHQEKAALSEWLDRTRHSTHRRLCKTVKWFDGLFGDKYEFDDDNFRGKVILGFEHDEIEGFDPKLRIRLKTKLPNVSQRLDAFIGRVEEDDYISDSQFDQDSITNVGLRSDDDDEAEWLVGIGYRNPKKQFRGFDVSLGAKISSGLNPYAKLRHQYHFKLNEPHFLRSSQTIFWRRDKGYGASASLNYTYLLNQENILEADAGARFTEDDEQWEWVAGSTWHHSINDRQGVSSRVYVRGEEENAVSIPEYGVTFTYRQPVFRPWFFVETGVDFRMLKEFEEEDYEDSIRFGIQAEMLLGDYYRRNKRKTH